MTAPERGSTDVARDLISLLIRQGVTEIVVAPGSRNAPVSFAAADAAEAGLVRLHTRLDERSAAFLALGLAKAGPPAAVLCTSGTAVANLHPAMLEAAHTGVRLFAVTADRPAVARGTEANQTTDQLAAFGPLVPCFDLALGAPPPRELPVEGPIQLNPQFADPLLPLTPWQPTERQPGYERPVPPTPAVLDQGPRTVVVAGDDAGPAARRLAEEAGWPLLAEPSSGARTGPALRCYRLLLEGELGAEIERAVVYGRPTLSRPVGALLRRVEVVSVPPRGAWAARPYAVAEEGPAFTAGTGDPAWLARWREADADLSRRVDTLVADEPELTPYEAAGAVSRALPPGGLLVVGASSPIRDLDLMATPYVVGEHRKVISNRGLSGIDGVVSTAIGAALVRDSTRSIALVGDVTFLHDANGLVVGPGQPEPDLTFVVVNDDGGSIFATLEQGDEQYADRYDALFGAPHGVDLASLCAATRTHHWPVESLPELEQALASPNGGIEVIEVRVRRDNRRELDQRIRRLAGQVT